jgi:hypothetical protein
LQLIVGLWDCGMDLFHLFLSNPIFLHFSSSIINVSVEPGESEGKTSVDASTSLS